MWSHDGNHVRINVLKQDCDSIENLLQYLKTLHFVHIARLCILYATQNKHGLFL
jgi:hypothetical protein